MEAFELSQHIILERDMLIFVLPFSLITSLLLLSTLFSVLNYITSEINLYE